MDPTTYASPDEAVEEFAKEIEPKTLRLDSEIGAGKSVGQETTSRKCSCTFVCDTIIFHSTVISMIHAQ